MDGSQDQFRISGKACVVPPPDNPFHTMTLIPRSLATSALDEGGEAEREDSGDGRDAQGKYDWEKKRKEAFEAMKPEMKASWCSPVAPGSQTPSYDEPNKWPSSIPNLKDLKTDADRKNYETALSKFSMIIIEPLQIDWVQLGEKPNRRTLFTRRDEQHGSHWSEEILAP